METQIWQRYKDRGVLVLGVNVDELASVVEAFVRQFQLTYPVLLGNDQLKNQYNLAGSHVSPFPRDYIIGKNGLIAYAAAEFDPEAMIAVIEKELGATAVEERNETAPQDFALQGSYPNPAQFANVVRIEYRLPQPSAVRLQIYDLNGRLVRTLAAGQQSAGEHTAHWNGRDEAGAFVPSGAYFLRLQTRHGLHARKLMVIR
jgi:hypothetical protein